MARQATWTNNDGLVVGFGRHTEDNNVAAVTSDRSGRKTMRMKVDLTTLPDTFAAANRTPQAAVIRRGSVIHEATIRVITAATSGGAPTLDIGLWGTNDVVDDADGIDAAIALTAIDAVGEVVQCDGAVVNGVVSAGATANSDVVIAPSYNTAVYTAGEIEIEVVYTEPAYDDPLAN